MEAGLETEADLGARTEQAGQVDRAGLMGLKIISVALKTTMA